MKKKAFTLIELIAVLVILAILALIVTPLVMNIIKKSKDAANKRSVDAYGHAVELAASEYLLDTGKKTSDFSNLKIKYNGNKVECAVKEIYKNNIFLSECSVNGSIVKDSKNSDGYYHYGDIMVFANAYNELVSKTITKYKNENYSYPKSFDQLSINDDKLNVTCEETRINSDGSYFLSKCMFHNIMITSNDTDDGYYHWGEYKYIMGDIVKYKNIDFYVMENTDRSGSTIHLIKKYPIMQGEVRDLIQNTEIAEQINFYSDSSNLYMNYYYHALCMDSVDDKSGCVTDYSLSSVKQIVDLWTANYLDKNDLVKDNSGYYARLLNEEDLFDKFGFYYDKNVTNYISSSDVKFLNFCTWTSVQLEDSEQSMGKMCYNGLYSEKLWRSAEIVPVINIKVSALSSQEV